jgi:CheY-like chemotaxis protein
MKQGVNGLEILEFVQTNPETKLDFILLDLNMPIMDGFEACKQIVNFYKDKKMFAPEKKKESSKSIAMSVI